MTDDLDKPLQELLAERGTVEPDAVDRALGGIDRLPERRPTRRSMPLAAAAVVALAVIGLALATTFRGPAQVATPSPSIASPVTSPSAAATTPEPTPTMQPRPVWAVDLASHLDCDGPPADLGNDVPPIPQEFDLAPTPDGALQLILVPYQSLPVSGYTQVLVNGHWALHRYLVNGRPKVHIVSYDQFPDARMAGWSVVGVRACDQSEFADAEFGPDANEIWSDASGDPVRTDMLTSQDVSGCFPDQTFFLLLFDPDYAQYVRDPSGHFADNTLVPFDADVRLPTDAVDTGLHTDGWHLFTIPSRRAVFIRTSDGSYELWPRAKEPVGCM